MPLDLTLSPLYRINGQESASSPGLLAMMPPRKTARGREQDRLVVYLLLTGNATFSTAEYMQLASDAATQFYQSAGPLTSAMRAAAESINRSLLERNMASSGRGQYAIGWLTLAALRDSNCTLLLSGPMHAFILGQEARHIFEPGLSGKGLGIAQAATHYFTQNTLEANDRLLFTGKVPSAWESTLGAVTHASLESTRRRLLTLTTEDLHGVLMQATQGTGALNVLKMAVEARPEARSAAKPAPPPPPSTVELPRVEATESTPEPDPEFYPAHIVQPSAYTIAPQPEEQVPAASVTSSTRRTSAGEFPSSIPRAKPKLESINIPAPIPEPKEEEAPPIRVRRTRTRAAPRVPSQWMRQTAKAIINGIQAWRRGNERLNQGTRNFLPRLLPGNEAGESKAIPAYAMNFMAIVIPLIVCTIGVVMYLRFGRSIQYDNYLIQAQTASAQAASLTDPIMQRDAWKSVLLYVDKAESYRKTDETKNLRSEAEAKLDQLLGIVRLQFQPAFSSGLGIEISRMAATESDLYLLDAKTGEVLRANNAGRGFQMDNAFNCKPGQYGGYQVGPLVDILAMPIINQYNATVLGVDATGNLLYCAPNQVAQAAQLPPPDTNWGRVTGIILDGGNLYALDAPSHAVWVYTGKDSSFVDRPYFFFGSQIPEIQDSIDLAVSGDDLYLLHADGHLSTCSYSRIDARPTLCQDPAALINPYAAYKDTDLFGQAHITQMLYTSPPDATILLLGADSQVVLRFTPRSLELQNQLRPLAGGTTSLPSAPVGAMTTGPNHVLYLAVRDQIYFTTNMP